MRTTVGRRTELPRHAEVVVIGGASLAYRLAEAGVGDVVVVERGRVASGSSGKPGLRAQFSDPLNSALGARGLQTCARFRSRIGIDISMERAPNGSRHREKSGMCRG
jgi:sarcosine oxidase subunit beta